MKKRIIYICGEPSSGKTYNIAEHMKVSRAEWNKNNNWVVSAISIDLAENEIKSILQKAGYHVVIIHSEVVENCSVGKTFAEKVAKYKDEQNIAILIQHQAFDIIDNGLFRDNFQHIQDEGSGIERSLEVVTDSRHPFEDYLEVNESGVLKLTAKGKQSHSALNHVFLELRALILNGKRNNFLIREENSSKIGTKVTDNAGREQFKIEVWSVPTFDYYENDTVILTSKKDNCQYYQRFKNKIEIKEIKMEPRINGKNRNVIIHTLTDKSKNTRGFREKNKEFVNAALKHWKANVKKALVFVNKIDEGKVSDTNWIKIPANVHGQNCFKTYHNIIILGSVNNTKNIIKTKEEQTGMSAEKQYETGPCELFFQMIMRTSLRDPEATEDVHVYLLDNYTAEILKKRLETAYGFNVTIKFEDKFNNLVKVKNDTINALSKKERNRIQYLIKKAKNGKIKDKKVSIAILELSKLSKSHRGILEIEQKCKEKGVEL